MVLLVIGLLVVGARRLQHLRYLANDPLFARFCGLARIPSDRTVVNWLKQFTQCSLRALTRINSGAEDCYSLYRDGANYRFERPDGNKVGTFTVVAGNTWSL